MSDAILTLPPETVELIAGRVAELLAEQSPWMTREQAAGYLQLPVSRLEKDKTIPCHQDRPGGRVLYHRGKLDAHFLALWDDAGNGNAPAGGHTPGARQQEVRS